MTRGEVGEGDAPAGVPVPRPPLGSWARVYALVIAVLALDVSLLLWLTGRFR